MSTRMQSKLPTQNIPVEIWHTCWTNLDNRDYLALSMTCRLFYDICRPQLFENLIYLPTTGLLDENVSDEEYERWETSATHFEGKLKWLASDPRTSRYPRFFMFSGIPDEDLLHFGSQHPNAIKQYHSLLSTLAASLGSFTNLRKIRLEDIEVDNEVIQCFHTLSLLKDIYLQSVDISCNTASPLIRPAQLSILEWEPQTQFTPEALELFSNKELTFVEIQSYRYASPCLQHFISQGTSEVLTTLKIILDVEILPTLFAFLETCPRLTTLGTTVIYEPENFRPTYPTLSPSALPDLHCYEGVASLAAVVVPGRPVHSIVIKDAWEGSIKDTRASSVLHDLAKSSVAMKGISLPLLRPHPDIFHVVSTLFPKLEKLQLNFTMTEADMLDFPDDDRIPDEEYFNTTVPTEISSIPVDEDGCPVRLPTSMKGVIYWLCLNKLPLPPTLTKLGFIQRNHLHGFQRLYKTCLSFREQYQTLDLLSSHSRRLKYVVFGGQHMQWVVGDDGEWKPGRDYVFYMNHRAQIVGARRPNAPAA